MVLNGDAIPILFYFRGIIRSPLCFPFVNHAVLAVGYGVTKPKRKGKKPIEYVIIKNTWGWWWGEWGYMRISMSQDFYEQGLCGIFKDSYIAFVDYRDNSPKKGANGISEII